MVAVNDYVRTDEDSDTPAAVHAKRNDESVTEWRLRSCEALMKAILKENKELRELVIKISERVSMHDMRVNAIDATLSKCTWVALLAMAGALGNMILNLIPHTQGHS